MTTRRRAIVLSGVALLTLAMVGLQFRWLSLNERPHDWDTAWYLENALTFHRIWIEQGVRAYFAAVENSFQAKAPGVPAVSLGTLLLLGPSSLGAVATNVLFWLAGGVYLYALARRWLSARAALVAALASMTMPLSFALGRSFFVETALTTAVVAALYHAAASDGFRRLRHVAPLAAWVGFGLLTKVNFPMYVGVPALALALQADADGKRRFGPAITGWGVATALGAALAWTLWYGKNYSSVLAFATNTSFGALAEVYYVPIRTYLPAVAVHGASPWLLLVLTGLLARGTWRHQPDPERRCLLWSALWFVPPFLLLLAAPNRELRYVAPLLPALALAVGALAEPLLREAAPAARRAVAGLLAFPLAYFVLCSAGTPLDRQLEAFFYGNYLGGYGVWYEAPAPRERWPNRDILRAIDERAEAGAEQVLRLNVDIPELNHNNLRVDILLAGTRVLPAAIDQTSPGNAFVAAYDGTFLLSPIRDPREPNFLNVQNAFIRSQLNAGALPYRLVREFQAPSGYKLGFYERRCIDEMPPPPSDPVARFEGGFTLNAFAIERVHGQVLVRTRWSVDAPPAANYTHFVHVTNAEGTTLEGLDHGPCRDVMQTTRWQPGRQYFDDYMIPAHLARPERDLRFGLFDRKSGERLRVLEHGAAIEIDQESSRLVRRDFTADRAGAVEANGG